MLSVRLVTAVVALGALLPGIVFLLDRSATVVILSLVSVLLLAASLHTMFGPGSAAVSGGSQ